MILRAVLLVTIIGLVLSGCDGKTAAENHREAAAQQTAGGFKEGVGGLVGDKSLRKAGEAQSSRGRTNEKVGDVKDAVHDAVH